MNKTLAPLIERLETGDFTRILAFGSSNTVRRLPGMHWFDCLDLAIAQKYGRIHHCINAGIGGDTSRDLLKRFERDAAFYRPHAVFVTIGGNDSSPLTNISPEEFEQNLNEIWGRFNKAGTFVIFQTYYAPDSDGSEHFIKFYELSNIVRKVAVEKKAGLVDHLKRWEPLRQNHPEIYARLMMDPFHVSPLGNKVVGADIVHAMNMEFSDNNDFWTETLNILKIMDRLSV